MILKNTIAFLTLICLCGCVDETSGEKYSRYKPANAQNPEGLGFTIKNGPRQGFTYHAPNGTEYAYRYSTATITNDSVVPMRLEVNFAKEKLLNNDSLNQIVFILPRQLTPEQQQFDKSMSNELKLFLSKVADNPVTLDTVLNTKEHCVITFGVLTKVGYPEAWPMVSIVRDKEQPAILLQLKLDRFLAIPCGRVSFNK